MMLKKFICGVIAIAAFCFPCAAYAQTGVGETCIRDVLEVHKRDQNALTAKPQGPVMESACRSVGKLVTCHYYDNRNTPNITFELRSSFAKVTTCFEQFGKTARKNGNMTYYDLPIESCSIRAAEKEFDAWGFAASCGPRLPF